jgi:sulfur carrier protein
MWRRRFSPATRGARGPEGPPPQLSTQVRSRLESCWPQIVHVRILLNGESHELSGTVTIQRLLDELGIDSRRVAVERNLVVVRRAHYTTELVADGDEIEIVNFVGGG